MPKVFDIPFSACTMADALDKLEQMNKEARSTGKSKFVAFINAHCLNIAYKDKEYSEILQKADVVWPDGIGVKMAGKILGFEVPENVNGTDFFPLACQKPYTIYMLGAAPGVAQKAMENAMAAYPNAKFVGADHGFFADEAAVEAAIQKVNEANPDILLVALGVPRQEKWVAKYQDKLKCGVVIAVGGLLDFVSGRIPRAPLWMRKCGLEWTFRLMQEPVRLFKRYIIGNPVFLFRVYRSK